MKLKNDIALEICLKEIASNHWNIPSLPTDIPQGDMPGDKICISKSHVLKANTILPHLAEEILPYMQRNLYSRAVIAVYGGSGVGKSEIASILGYYFDSAGVGTYVLSGDNYPHRIPRQNDAERLRVFRKGGIKGLVVSGVYTPEIAEKLKELQLLGDDAEPTKIQEYPWLDAYQLEGKKALKAYLGTDKEIDFSELESIIASFKNGADEIWLKKMGREETELYYDKVNFSATKLLIIEWTHGNSDYYKGVDVSVLLNSTPEETLAHRQRRGRDGQADTAFTTMLLGLEQQLLHSQTHKKKLIVAKDGSVMDLREYQNLMTGL